MVDSLRGDDGGVCCVGTAVGLSFFFLILGAGPFIVWYFFGEKIKAFIASRRGETSYPTSSGTPTICSLSVFCAVDGCV